MTKIKSVERNHFSQVGKMVILGSRVAREIEDKGKDSN